MTLRSALVTASFVTIVGLSTTTVLADPPPLPPEAFEACSGKSSGGACSVSFHGHTLEGTCSEAPSDRRLFCRPSSPPPPPPDGKGPPSE